MPAELPSYRDQHQFMRSLVNDKTYREGAFSKIAKRLGMTVEQAIKHIRTHPLHFSPTERRSANIASRFIRTAQREDKPKRDVIGTPRRM